jgi:phosphohistidine phosphatase
MLVFLVRHAHAVTAEENPVRPLSSRGRMDALRIANFLRQTPVVRPAQYWHSPLLRAGETARLLAMAIDPDALLVETDDLLPEDDPEAMAHRLAEYPAAHDLALVGHDPHLSALATLLVRGKTNPVLFALRKGAIIALERTDRQHKNSELPRWRIRWHLSPELLVNGTEPAAK